MHDVALPVLGIVGLLTIVSFLPPLAVRLRMPFTVLLAIVGVALGGLVTLLHDHASTGPLHDLTAALSGLNVSSSTFLVVFLPALLFESTLAIDVRRLMDDVGPILLLAVGAVLICSLTVGFAMAAASGFPLVACLLLGAIVATTDPAAVVGIFRDIGAPRRLSILVEGECLFNDAAAIAIFTMLVAGYATGTQMSIGGGIAGFIVSFLGGIGTGFIMGRLACLALPFLRGWRLAEVTLTVTLAYLSFLIADLYLHASGVVAVVVAGLVISAIGRTRVTPSTWETLVETWEQLAFWANSLIFLMAALLIPKLLAGMDFRFVYLLAVLFGATLAARALVLFGILPALSHFGVAERVSAEYKTAIVWGGLRGAVSLALALAVTENQSLPADVKQFVAALTTGFVLLTLFLNGPTLRPLIRVLKLDQLSAADRTVRQRVFGLALANIRDRVETIGKREEADPGLITDISAQIDRRAATMASEIEALPRLSEEEQIYTGLATICAHEHELALEAFRQQVISGRMVDDATAQISRLSDGLKTGGRAGYEAAVRASLGFPIWFRMALHMQYRFGEHRWLSHQLSDRFEYLFTTETDVRQLIHFARGQLGDLFGEAVAGTLTQILQDRLVATQQALTALKLQFPDYAHELQRRYLGRVAWRLEDDSYRAMLEDSTISREVYADLTRELAQRRQILDRRPRLDVVLDRASLVSRVPMFQGLEKHRLDAIARLLRPRFVVPNEAIVKTGEDGDAMYFIATGAVEVRLPAGPVQLGSGQFFGEIALITKRPRGADVVTLGFCRLLVLDASDFDTLMRTDAQLRDQIAEVAQSRIAANAPTQPNLA